MSDGHVAAATSGVRRVRDVRIRIRDGGEKFIRDTCTCTTICVETDRK